MAVSGVLDLKTDQFVGRVDHVGVVGFVPVMILRSHPEDREYRPAQQVLESLRQANRRDALVERVKGAAKESRLLAGRDDDSALLGPSVEPLFVDAIGNLQCPERTPSGVRIEASVDAVEEGAIGLRVLPGARVEGGDGFAPAQIFLEQG